MKCWSNLQIIGSLRITNIQGNIKTNVKHLFKISAAWLVLNIFFYVCVYFSVYFREFDMICQNEYQLVCNQAYFFHTSNLPVVYQNSLFACLHVLHIFYTLMITRRHFLTVPSWECYVVCHLLFLVNTWHRFFFLANLRPLFLYTHLYFHT